MFYSGKSDLHRAECSEHLRMAFVRTVLKLKAENRTHVGAFVCTTLL